MPGILKKGFFIMNYLYGDWFDYNEVEKIKEHFDIKDFERIIGYNNEGIRVDFSYNNHMYRYQRLTKTHEDQLLTRISMIDSSIIDPRNAKSDKWIDIEIYDLETMIDITDKPYTGEIFPFSKEKLRDWRYVTLMFDLIKTHVDDADGCKHLVSLSYQDFKNDLIVKSIINVGIFMQCETYLNDSYGPVMEFQKAWAQDGIYIAYHLIMMNHPLMEMVKQYPEYKPRLCKVVEAARQLGLYEEQLIISEFVASIQDSPDKWDL